jgi:hypothetical protein
MDRLRSADEHECEQAIRHLLDQADVGVFERAADELDGLRAEVERLRAENRKLRGAMQTVLDDNETGAGGWGPDVTMAEILRVALEAKP